jgi:PhzF family phenazine biosynthesis protein
VGVPIFQVDAFTSKPFAGNPAAVCLLDGPAPEVWMQAVAAEMNLSETAFLYAARDGWDLRWFTPVVEVDLCGHATLASACVLWQERLLPFESEARFHTRSGLLRARRAGDTIEMTFPAEPCSPAEAPPALLQAIGVEPVFVGLNRFDYLVEVASEEAVRDLKPDLPILKTVPVRGVIVTARSSSSGYDFVSRFFGPRAGIDEDPVTGSAHCCLGPYWAAKLGTDALTGYQASRRGGVVGVRPRGDHVLLAGEAVTVLTGELLSLP